MATGHDKLPSLQAQRHTIASKFRSLALQTQSLPTRGIIFYDNGRALLDEDIPGDKIVLWTLPIHFNWMQAVVPIPEHAWRTCIQWCACPTFRSDMLHLCCLAGLLGPTRRLALGGLSSLLGTHGHCCRSFVRQRWIGFPEDYSATRWTATDKNKRHAFSHMAVFLEVFDSPVVRRQQKGNNWFKRDSIWQRQFLYVLYVEKGAKTNAFWSLSLAFLSWAFEPNANWFIPSLYHRHLCRLGLQKQQGGFSEDRSATDDLQQIKNVTHFHTWRCF